ncbi:MAG TPA: transposase [Bryobacteraceae bacterium]
MQSAPPKMAGQAFLTLDRSIDRAASGPIWLRDRRIASLVVQTLVAGEIERGFYQLRAYVVMPNHVHAVLLPKMPLPAITRWLKGSTARRANRILARTGQPFWQDESYDHWVRTPNELERIVRYIERNPVSAGLVSCEEDWPWSSATTAGETACPTM